MAGSLPQHDGEVDWQTLEPLNADVLERLLAAHTPLPRQHAGPAVDADEEVIDLYRRRAEQVFASLLAEARGPVEQAALGASAQNVEGAKGADAGPCAKGRGKQRSPAKGGAPPPREGFAAGALELGAGGDDPAAVEAVVEECARGAAVAESGEASEHAEQSASPEGTGGASAGPTEATILEAAVDAAADGGTSEAVEDAPEAVEVGAVESAVDEGTEAAGGDDDQGAAVDSAWAAEEAAVDGSMDWAGEGAVEAELDGEYEGEWPDGGTTQEARKLGQPALAHFLDLFANDDWYEALGQEVPTADDVYEHELPAVYVEDKDAGDVAWSYWHDPWGLLDEDDENNSGCVDRGGAMVQAPKGARSDVCVLYIHGGAFCVNSCWDNLYKGFCSCLAAATGMTVVCPDHLLSGEDHPDLVSSIRAVVMLSPAMDLTCCSHTYVSNAWCKDTYTGDAYFQEEVSLTRQKFSAIDATYVGSEDALQDCVYSPYWLLRGWDDELLAALEKARVPIWMCIGSAEALVGETLDFAQKLKHKLQMEVWLHEAAFHTFILVPRAPSMPEFPSQEVAMRNLINFIHRVVGPRHAPRSADEPPVLRQGIHYYIDEW
ncbi:unnamed protein product [Prorocentrum cordatum]|uniref:Alpha/beta hydrolase fold-3 domain-containing protein n=1 Tax=Prorocentrum cordatum TaxID=2364126 RepID=A0ABN9R0N4_9DINO|nr:unnamed protein product [Polarella glacialis]